MKKKPYNLYAVSIGRDSGYLINWGDANELVRGYPDSEYKGFYTHEEAEEWMEEPSRKRRRLDRRDQDKEKKSSQVDLEAKVKALNEKHALEKTADVETNTNEINDDDIDALSKAYGALKMGGNMIVTKRRSGPDISVTPRTPPLSPPASTRSTRSSSSSSSSSAGDTTPSSPPSAASVKRTSASPSP